MSDTQISTDVELDFDAIHRIPVIVLEGDTARTRRTDPSTSHEAADSNDVHGSKAYVLDILKAWGPLADFEVEAHHREYLKRFPVITPDYSPSRLRTARSALVDDGLVEYTGYDHLTPSGRHSRVWQVVE